MCILWCDRAECLAYRTFSAGRKADVLLRGIWLHEESPLWRYDLDEGVRIELLGP